MVLSYDLFLSSLASRFSLDHRKVNLASIIAPTMTAQIQRGGLSTFILCHYTNLCSCLENYSSRRWTFFVSTTKTQSSPSYSNVVPRTGVLSVEVVSSSGAKLMSFLALSLTSLLIRAI